MTFSLDDLDVLALGDIKSVVLGSGLKDPLWKEKIEVVVVVVVIALI